MDGVIKVAISFVALVELFSAWQFVDRSRLRERKRLLHNPLLMGIALCVAISQSKGRPLPVLVVMVLLAAWLHGSFEGETLRLPGEKDDSETALGTM